MTAPSTSAQVTPGRSAANADLLRGDRVVEEAAHLVASAGPMIMARSSSAW